jgi:toxin ParE1/3/4
MEHVSFTHRAEADLQQIVAYTQRIWGQTQAIRTLEDMQECTQWLAEDPVRGRLFDCVGPGVRRVDEGRYVVFFRELRGGILILRILHQTMLLERRSTDEERTRETARFDHSAV